VIGGESDTVTRASHSEQIAATIAHAKLVLLPGVHILNVEQADRFNSEVLSFLRDAT
jgi:3-oxoadipate enol-lactonase